MPREFLPTPKVVAILKQIQTSTGDVTPAAGRIMMTTKEHEIKEVHGPVILEAMRKSVDDLVDLWDFMELAQQKIECVEPSSIATSRKRRGDLDSAEGQVQAGLAIAGNKRRFVERSDAGT